MSKRTEEALARMKTLDEAMIGRDPLDPDVRAPAAAAAVEYIAAKFLDQLDEAGTFPTTSKYGEGVTRDNLFAFIAARINTQDEPAEVLLADVEQGRITAAMILHADEANVLRGRLGAIFKGDPAIIVRPPSALTDKSDPNVQEIIRAARPAPSGGEDPTTIQFGVTGDKTMRLMHTKGSIRTALLAALGTDRPVALTGRAFLELTTEVGSPEASMEWLAQAAAKTGKPMAVNANDETLFISPPEWTSERLKGWVAGNRDHLERAFGTIDPDSFKTFGKE
jgi:hypothetical protein